MKISFNFDTSSRSIHFQPEDELELLALHQIELECAKGNLPKVVESKVEEGSCRQFRLECRINGFPKDQLKESPR